FSSVALNSVKMLGGDPDKANVNGGAVALGHPIGASGGRIVTTLINELSRNGGGLGLAAICSGGGQGGAPLLEVRGHCPRGSLSHYPFRGQSPFGDSPSSLSAPFEHVFEAVEVLPDLVRGGVFHDRPHQPADPMAGVGLGLDGDVRVALATFEP